MTDRNNAKNNPETGKMTRREFIGGTAALGLSTAAFSSLLAKTAQAAAPKSGAS